MITYSVEDYSTMGEEIKSLVNLHHDEVEDYDGELDPDYDLYQQMSETGLIKAFGIRDGGYLVGYAIYVCRNNPHYRTERWAVNDIMWLHPTYRRFGVGNAFFDFIEQTLAPCTIQTSVKLNHPELGMLLQARGHRPDETTFIKRLT